MNRQFPGGGGHSAAVWWASAWMATVITLLSCGSDAARTTRKIATSTITRKYYYPSNTARGVSNSRPSTNDTSENDTESDQCSPEVEPCRPGILLPVWQPASNVTTIAAKVGKGFVYFISLCYFFLGISIISDRLMAAIEVITSKQREVTVTEPQTGEEKVVKVRIWNQTVSNLTLLTIGSSASEILLAIIEVVGNNFEAGDLGPSTIVGSAAYHVFLIVALCVYALPKGVTKRIKHMPVFVVTTLWSMFAYVWLYTIIAWSSPGVVSVWEGILTFVFFPLTVTTAYVVDKGLQPYKLVTKSGQSPAKAKANAAKKGESKIDSGPLEYRSRGSVTSQAMSTPTSEAGTDKEVELLETQRLEYIDLLRDLHAKHPKLHMHQLEAMAAPGETMNKDSKNRAFNRIATMKNFARAKSVKHKAEHEGSSTNGGFTASTAGLPACKIFFDPVRYAIMENMKVVEVTIKREGYDLEHLVYVDFFTEDSTATAGVDYVTAKGTLVFMPGETSRSINLQIIDDERPGEDRHFHVVLWNPRVADDSPDPKVNDVVLGEFKVATIIILDNDHAGVFDFDKAEYHITESVESLHVKVLRSVGAKGRVRVGYNTMDDTAVKGRDYKVTGNKVVFADKENENVIHIEIKNTEAYQKDAVFFVLLENARLIGRGKDSPTEEAADGPPIPLAGEPRLGHLRMVSVRIKECEQFKKTVDNLMEGVDSLDLVRASTWTEQFAEAIAVPEDDNDNESVSKLDENRQKEELPRTFYYLTTGTSAVIRAMSIAWRIMFALVPPTGYCGGWLCFIVSIVVTGVLTAVIADLANHFGCTIGLKDAVTAISLVALGTTLPDTITSKQSAVKDDFADSTIGNVVGSNAVSVFLGLGIAWSFAAIKHAASGTIFRVKVESLGFAVKLFCVFALCCMIILYIRRRKFIGKTKIGGRRPQNTLTELQEN